MADKIIDFTKAKQEQRQQRGWTLEEIRARAAQERALYRGLGQAEPDNLASGGDMKKILEDSDDE